MCSIVRAFDGIRVLRKDTKVVKCQDRAIDTCFVHAKEENIINNWIRKMKSPHEFFHFFSQFLLLANSSPAKKNTNFCTTFSEEFDNLPLAMHQLVNSKCRVFYKVRKSR